MTDDVMKGLTQTVTLGPAELDKLIEGQISFFQQQEKRMPNCVLLGIAVIQILDGAGKLHRDEKTGEAHWRDLKLYIDGDNEVSIACAYNPFIDLQKRIIVQEAIVMEIVEIFNLLLRCANSAKENLAAISYDSSKAEIIQNAAGACGKLDIIIGELNAYKTVLEEKEEENVPTIPFPEEGIPHIDGEVVE